MEYLFPTPSPYEIVDNSILNISFNIAYLFDKTLKNKNYKKSPSIENYKENSPSLHWNFFLFVFFLILKVYYRNF